VHSAQSALFAIAMLVIVVWEALLSLDQSKSSGVDLPPVVDPGQLDRVDTIMWTWLRAP
jgi:hypothetical protein